MVKRAEKVAEKVAVSVNNYMEAPPLGVLPRKAWITARLVELYEACARYVKEGYPVPLEWSTEITHISEELAR